MTSSSAIEASSQSGVSPRNVGRLAGTGSMQTLIQALLAPTGAQDGRQQERRLLHAVDARQAGNAMAAVAGHRNPTEANVIVGPVVCGDKQRGGNERARAQPDDDRLRDVRITTPSVISNRHRQLPGPTEIVPEPHGEKLSPDRRETLWERLLTLARGEQRLPRS